MDGVQYREAEEEVAVDNDLAVSGSLSKSGLILCVPAIGYAICRRRELDLAQLKVNCLYVQRAVLCELDWAFGM